MIDLLMFKDYLIPALTAIFAWFSKDKILTALNITERKAEVEDTRIKTIQANLDLYQEMLTDIDARYKNRLADLEEELTRFKNLCDDMSKIIDEQKVFIAKHTASLKRYVDKYGKLDK